MKYFVNVSDENNVSKDYIMSINKTENTAANKPIYNCQNNPQTVLEISKTEYEHCIKRLDRLDNKVYIMLTVCAFIFVMLTGALSNIEKIKMPNMLYEWIMLVIYGFAISYACYRTISLIFKLIKVLSSIKMNRLDSADIVEYNMVLAHQNQVVRYITGIYERATFKNNQLIDKKYNELDECVKLIKRTIVALLVVTIIGVFEPKATADTKKLSEIVIIFIKYLQWNV
ncbi:hypothetical protein [Selenomonas ruminantium]|uniref:SMODS and SLOG-associating 2TM effector domain-containing protein n=1 Tax=Selenomonas ruminantium TaxID=971 RepID=A0A1H0M7E0_SELRU|nr:hypothetical protein [Selenomonas ruminantium]SDO76422.1 hypothetical protein SAMN05216366_10156 [Selenomonas ruminantium]